jgi:hypothetical protein
LKEGSRRDSGTTLGTVEGLVTEVSRAVDKPALEVRHRGTLCDDVRAFDPSRATCGSLVTRHRGRFPLFCHGHWAGHPGRPGDLGEGRYRSSMSNRYVQGVPLLTEVGEYAGQEVVAISCTQLGTQYSATQARKVVDAWVGFFASGPSPIRELEFTTRTPKRLFDALAGQAQLRRLAVKWGDYADLAALANCSELRDLSLRGASSVTSVATLGELSTLEQLALEGLKRVHDLGPLGRLERLTHLELGGDWMSSRIAHLDSIGFMRNLTSLEDVLLHTIIVDDLDYSPLLALPRLKSVRVMRARGMTPPHEYLKSRLPWAE